MYDEAYAERLYTDEMSRASAANIGRTLGPSVSKATGLEVVFADLIVARNVLVEEGGSVLGSLLLRLQAYPTGHNLKVLSLLVNHEHDWGLSQEQLDIVGGFSLAHGRNDHVPTISTFGLLVMPAFALEVPQGELVEPNKAA